LNVQLLSLLLSVSPIEESPVDFTKEFILGTQNGQIIRDLLGDRSDDEMLRQFYSDPTWIADQFLNPNEFMVTIRDLVVLVKESGFKICDWIGAPADISKCFKSSRLVERFKALTSEQQMIALDLLLKPSRYFVVLQKF
jgi:hypothetical protein